MAPRRSKASYDFEGFIDNRIWKELKELKEICQTQSVQIDELKETVKQLKIKKNELEADKTHIKAQLEENLARSKTQEENIQQLTQDQRGWKSLQDDKKNRTRKNNGTTNRRKLC